jgi:hypothetical protein
VCSETFGCGDELSCEIATEYCISTTGGTAPSQTTYECAALPSGCSDCDCLAEQQGDAGAEFSYCSTSQDGALTVLISLP